MSVDPYSAHHARLATTNARLVKTRMAATNTATGSPFLSLTANSPSIFRVRMMTSRTGCAFSLRTCRGQNVATPSA